MRRLDPPLSLSELARLGAARLIRGEPDTRVDGFASLPGAAPTDLAFLASAQFADAARTTRAGVVIASPALTSAVPGHAALLESDHPQRAFAAIVRTVSTRLQPAPAAGVHPHAAIGASVRIGANVHIGAFATIGDGAMIGDGAIIECGAHVGAGASIGAGSRLRARAVVEYDCVVGRECQIFSGTVIGADGFGFVDTTGGWEKIPQLGRTVLGDSVEIGANCAIDRGALDDTLIGDGCKLDNLIQIAHNVRVGERTAIAGCVGVAGSTRIGRRCRIGGAVGITGHIEICDDVTISAMTFVSRSIRRSGFYSGVFPLMDNADWHKSAAIVRQLPQWRARWRAAARTDRTDE